MNRYWTTDFWHNLHPGSDVVDSVFYSTNYYTSRAIALIQNFSDYHKRQSQGSVYSEYGEGTKSWGGGTGKQEALWVHLAHQAVHSPIVDVPPWERIERPRRFWDGVYADMLHVLDKSIENITETLKVEGVWNETLLIVQSDNGGVGALSRTRAKRQYRHSHGSKPSA